MHQRIDSLTVVHRQCKPLLTMSRNLNLEVFIIILKQIQNQNIYCSQHCETEFALKHSEQVCKTESFKQTCKTGLQSGSAYQTYKTKQLYRICSTNCKTGLQNRICSTDLQKLFCLNGTVNNNVLTDMPLKNLVFTFGL